MTETTTVVSSDACRFITHVARGRWVSLFASFVIMAGAGGTYIFGIYSKEIKTSLGYDQSTLNLLGFFKDLGANIGVLSGLIAEVTPTWFLLFIGSAMNFSGFLMIWLAVTGKIAKPKVWQMCMYICLGANSQNFANTGVLVTCVTNFPENRGVLLGLLKGFAGLSGAIMTQIYLALYGHNPQSLILLVAWLPAAICIFFVYTIRVIKAVRQENEVKMLYNFLYVSIALALFLMAMTLAQNLVTFSRAAYASSGAIVACFLLLVPLAIAVQKELVLWNRKKESEPTNPIKVMIQEPAKSDHKDRPELNKNPTCFGDICDKPSRGEDYTILQALLSLDMMVLFVSTMCGIGASLTAVDNLGQIGESLGYPTKTVQTFVSLVSIWNYFGRIFAGIVSEKLITKYKCPRPLMTTLVLLLSCVGHLLIAFPISGSVYIASVIIGFSFGAQFPLMNAIVSELFGLKHYATLFNVGQLASPLGSYILNVKVAGLLYDREALKTLERENLSRDSVKELTCIGPRCFRLAFVILACVTFFGALASILLVVRTREFYRGDIYKKFRVEQKEIDQVEMNQGGEIKNKNDEYE